VHIAKGGEAHRAMGWWGMWVGGVVVQSWPSLRRKGDASEGEKKTSGDLQWISAPRGGLGPSEEKISACVRSSIGYKITIR